MAKFSQALLQGLLQPSFTQELGSAAKSLGATPGLMMAERQRGEQQQEVQQLLQQYANDPEQLNAIGQKFTVQGRTDVAQLFLDAAKTAKAKQMGQLEAGAMQMDQEVAGKRTAADEKLLSSAKIQMAKLAESLNLPELAKSVRVAQDKEALSDIAKEIRKAQIERAPSQTPGQRLSRAVQAGISKSNFYDLGLDTASDAVFNDTLSGLKGSETEAWVNETGEIKAYRFLNGKVWNDETKTYVEPGEMGLTAPAPTVQRVLDESSDLIRALGEESVKSIVDQKDKATAAKEKLLVINRQLDRLGGGMPTGIAANLSVGLRQVGQLMGMPYDPELVDAQSYMMEVANLVKTQIKAFGSGTSITDADREYTQRMVGGQITEQAEALEEMLKIYRDSAIETITEYNKVVEKTAKRVGGAENMGTFFTIDIPKSSAGANSLSPDAVRYIEEVNQ